MVDPDTECDKGNAYFPILILFSQIKKKYNLQCLKVHN